MTKLIDCAACVLALTGVSRAPKSSSTETNCSHKASRRPRTEGFIARLRSLTASVAIATLGMGLTPEASALAIGSYLSDGYSSLSLNLTGVTDLAGSPVDSGWLVAAEGSEINSGATSTGDAGAHRSTRLIHAQSWDASEGNVIGDVSPYQYSRSTSGVSGRLHGSADTLALLSLSVEIRNVSGQALTFMFDYEANAHAFVGFDNSPRSDFLGSAAALIDMTDTSGLIDRIVAKATADLPFGHPPNDTSEDVMRQAGSIMFTLHDSEVNSLNAFFETQACFSSFPADTQGCVSSVPATVPEPATVVLLTAGLIGFGADLRRRKAALKYGWIAATGLLTGSRWSLGGRD